jgi:NAD(P)-dependent dehydrogenase (short-subunit alcohol dehydrogenase family)
LKKVIITGASKGIGFELVKQFAELGFKVYALSRTKEALELLKNEYPLLEIFQVDLNNYESVECFVKDNSLSEISIVINNAGLLINKSFWELTDEDWDLQLNTNLMGTVRLIRALKNRFSQSAHIINISSMGGYQGSSKFPGLSAYSAAKGALSILTECLDEELEDGISVNALCLGAVQTEMLSQAFPGYQAPVSALSMAEYIYKFAVTANKVMSGKIIPVAKSNPE